MRKLAIVAVLAMLSLVVAPALGAGNQGADCPSGLSEGQNQEQVEQPVALGGNPDACSPGPAPNSGDGIPDGPGW